MAAHVSMRPPMRWLTRAPELRTALVVSWLLVVARSLVYAVFEHAHFDSDQAIVGLMAKHLSEGRAFPLFFYGQSYMLAVESWLAVPFFWVAGPTVAALKASLILTNIAVVSLIIVGLQRWGGLRPWLGFIAALFVIFPPPNTVADLVEAQGGNIEPFLWVLVLWFVRERPFWFGSLLAIGFLNREFVVYAVPVLLAGQAWSRTLFRLDTLRVWLFSLVAFLAVWQSVQALVPFSDAMGPGSRGGPATATRGSQLENLSDRVRVDLPGAPARTWNVITTGVAGLAGGRRMPDSQWGRDWVGYVLGITLLAAVIRVGRLWLRRAPTVTASFAWYLLGIGAMAAIGYAATRPVDEVIRRYILLSLFIPVGVTALWLTLEPNRRVRQAVVVLMLCWMTLSGVDNWRLWHRFSSGQEPDPMSEIVNAVEARGLSVVEAPYWRAYKLSFLTRERIKAASTDVIRITEYQKIAAAAGPGIMRLQEVPCDGGTSAGGWYLCPK